MVINRQRTIKLCRDHNGCQTHIKFHEGDIEAARKIREALTSEDYSWLLVQMGYDWIESTYPL